MFTRMILLIRDSAHAIRIAMKDPLHHDTLFGKVWEELFNKKGAAVPNFQHSDKLKALLVAAQAAGARPVGLPGNLQPLTAVLQCFSFAKQRFDSTVDPGAKLALLLLPVATVLAFSASDKRVLQERRKKARQTLEFMTSKNVTGLGISADWGIVWESYLRLFDLGDHDIAGSSEEIEGLIQSLEKLFVEGAVFQDKVWHGPVNHQPAIGGTFKLLPPVISHNMMAADVEGQFITTIVKNQLQHKCVFNVDGEPVVMWGALQSGEKTELASRIQNVAKVSIGRLRADFPKTEMRFFLRALDMNLVQAAFGHQGKESKQEALTRCCEAALNSLGCPESDVAPALLEYKILAKSLTCLAQAAQPLASKTNRETWGQCLDASFLKNLLPDKSFTHILDLIRFYVSILDGSCVVERGLAKVRAFIEENRSTQIDVLDDLAVMVDTELRPEDFAKKQHGSWEATAFGSECGSLWRDVLGARMGIHHLVNQERKPGTYKSVKAGVLKAIGSALVSRYVGQPLANQGPPSLAMALATRPAANSKAGTPKCPYWHKGFSSCLFFVLPSISLKCSFWGFAWEFCVSLVS